MWNVKSKKLKVDDWRVEVIRLKLQIVPVLIGVGVGYLSRYRFFRTSP
jgi:hypothetical protein